MILLIGNGPSGDTPAVAEAMRKARTVLRMNNWVPGRYTGDRCEIWGTSFNVDIVQNPDWTGWTWWTGWPYGTPGHSDYEAVLSQQMNHYARVASKALINRAFSLTTRHPSTGIVLAMMAAELGQIAVAGFDHFSAERHHYWTDEPAICEPTQYHDPDSERRILSGLLAANLFPVYR